MLSMIPLVKVIVMNLGFVLRVLTIIRVQLHDLAIGVLSRRIGGSKTGLINASFVRKLSRQQGLR